MKTFSVKTYCTYVMISSKRIQSPTVEFFYVDVQNTYTYIECTKTEPSTTSIEYVQQMFFYLLSIL